MPGFENVAFPQQAGPGRGEPRLDALAKALNVSVDTLKQAVEATRTELKDTKPTTAAERQAFRDQYEATLAAKLHISVDALKQAEQSKIGRAHV